MQSIESFLQNKFSSYLVIALLGLVVFIPSTQINFFGDEIAFIQRNEIHTTSDALHLFDKKDYDEEYYRPIGNFVSGLITLPFGYNLTLYRIFNLVLHIFNAILLFHFALLLFRRNKYKYLISCSSAVLFVLFPLNDLAVIWHTDLFDRLMTLFYLLSLIFFIKRGKVNYLSLLFFLLALLSKEMAFSLPLVIFASYYFLIDKKFKTSIYNSLPYLVLAGVVILLRIIVFNNNVFDPGNVHSSFGIVNIIKNYVFFLGLLAVPVFTYEIENFVRNNFSAIQIAGSIIGLIGSYLIFWWKKSDSFFWYLLIILILTILPASRLLMKWYLYFPSGVFSILLAYLIFGFFGERYFKSLYTIVLLVFIYGFSMIYTESNWIQLTNQGDTILKKFASEYEEEFNSNKKIIFLTIPAKVDNYPIYQLNFTSLVKFYTGTSSDVDILSRCSLSSFIDKIELEKNASSFSLSQEKNNNFILYGDKKNSKFNDSILHAERRKKIEISHKKEENEIIFSFSNGKFYKVSHEDIN